MGTHWRDRSAFAGHVFMDVGAVNTKKDLSKSEKSENRQRKALEKNRQREESERISKAKRAHPTILYLAKEAERTQPRSCVLVHSKHS